MRSILITALLMPFWVMTAFAQATPPWTLSETGPLIFQLPGSTRALGLGGTYPVVAPDPDVIFYNPALLQNANGFSLSTQFYGSNARAITASAANATGFGIGVQVLDYDIAGNAPVHDIGSTVALTRDGGRPAGEAALSVGYMRTFFRKVRLGAVAKWAGHWGAAQSGNAYAIDLGTTVNPLNWLTVALSVQNLGTDFEFGSASYNLPMRVALYVAQRSRVVGPLDVSFVAGALGGPDYKPHGSLGLEVGYWPFSGLNFYARAGGKIGTGEYRPTLLITPIEQAPFNLGAGVSYGRLSLDYALEPYQRAADAHRIGVRVR